MTETTKTVQVMDGIRAFGIDDDSSVMLRCPDCDELLWLTNPEDVSTLGDVIDAVTAHQCPPEVLAALSGEEIPVDRPERKEA